MADDTGRTVPGYLRAPGLYWRSVSALLVFQALGWAGAAGLGYLMISPELAKDYFSAHHTVKATMRLVLPGLAVSAAVGFVVVGVGSALSVRSHSRRLLEPLRQIDGLIRGLAAGRVPQPREAKRANAVDEVATALEPLRDRVRELRALAREVQKVSLELNYRSAGTSEVTLKDLKALAARLETLSSDLTRTSEWFEG